MIRTGLDLGGCALQVVKDWECCPRHDQNCSGKEQYNTTNISPESFVWCDNNILTPRFTQYLLTSHEKHTVITHFLNALIFALHSHPRVTRMAILFN